MTIEPQEFGLHNVFNVDNVAGVKYHCGKIYACQKYKGVIIQSNVRLRSMKTTRIISIPGMGEAHVDSNSMYASSITEHRVIKMDLNTLRVLNSVGTQGSDPGQFSYPNGVRLSKDNELYVYDSHRIQVFDQSLQFLRISR